MNNRELTKILTSGESELKPKFKKKLKNKFLATALKTKSSNKLIIKGFAKMSSKAKFMLTFIVVFTIVFASFFLFLIFPHNQNKYDQNKKLADIDLNTLLTEVVKNNNLEIREIGLTALTEPDNLEYYLNKNNSKLDNYSFMSIKTSVEIGPSFNKCKLFYEDLGGNYSIDEKIFWSTDPSKYLDSVSKSVTTVNDNNLVKYSVFKSEYNFEYRGGEYAIIYKKLPPNYDTTKSPVKEEVSDNNYTEETEETISIDDFFQSGGKLVDYISQNGKNYYIVEWRSAYENACSGSKIWGENKINDNPENVTINRIWIEEDTYYFWKTEWYLNSVEEKDLIAREYVETSYKLVDWTDIQYIFMNEYSDVPVKEYDPNNIDYEQTVGNYLESHKVDVLIDSNRNNNSIYFYINNSTNSYSSFYCSRGFFSNDEFGDKQYKELCTGLDDNVKGLLYNSTCINDDIIEGDNGWTYEPKKYVSLDAYTNDTAEESILAMENYEVKNLGKVKIKIDNEELWGDVYSIKDTHQIINGYNDEWNYINWGMVRFN